MSKPDIEKIDRCRREMAVLQEKEEKLYDDLIKDLQVDTKDEYLVDVLFDYLYNNGEYSRKLLKNYFK